MKLYPLRFEPIFQTYLWGGRRLGSDLNKPIGDEPTYAESWEVVDHGEHQSVVKFGELTGKTLGQLVKDFGPQLLGRDCYNLINDPARPENLIGRFPLLFKFLDAEKNLSVQVHPNDQMGSTLDPPDLGKTEAWYVLAAEPGAKVYAGLKQGITQEAFEKAISENTAEQVLHSVEPEPGDCVFIPAGTVHAIGAGLLIGEIQQCSNTTFRLYDWGRVGHDGKPRELHVEQGIAATDFSLGPVHLQPTQKIDEATVSIVDCDKFRLDRMQIDGERTLETRDSFKLLVVTSGSLTIADDPAGTPLNRGDVCLIPAELDSIHIQALAESELLWISPE